MTPLITYVAAIALLASAPDASARVARPASSEPSTCDGIADYADELRPANFRLVGETVLADGMTEVQIALDLRKRINAPFRAASVRPDLAALAPTGAHGDLGVEVGVKRSPTWALPGSLEGTLPARKRPSAKVSSCSKVPM